MNLKERGITVGDLFFILIIIIATSFIFKSLNKENQYNKTSNNPEIINLININYL